MKECFFIHHCYVSCDLQTHTPRFECLWPYAISCGRRCVCQSLASCFGSKISHKVGREKPDIGGNLSRTCRILHPSGFDFVHWNFWNPEPRALLAMSFTFWVPAPCSNGQTNYETWASSAADLAWAALAQAKGSTKKPWSPWMWNPQGCWASDYRNWKHLETKIAPCGFYWFLGFVFRWQESTVRSWGMTWSPKALNSSSNACQSSPRSFAVTKPLQTVRESQIIQHLPNHP